MTMAWTPSGLCSNTSVDLHGLLIPHLLFYEELAQSTRLFVIIPLKEGRTITNSPQQWPCHFPCHSTSPASPQAIAASPK